MPVLHHVLLGISLVSLAGAGVRLAAPAAPRGLERAIAAAAIACAIAVVEALLLGLAGLGGSAAALAGAAVATWLATLRLPRPEPSPARELAAWWQRLPPAPRLLAGALAGAWVVWVAWLLRHPALGFDSVLYHVSDATVWIGGGNPGSIQRILAGLPVTNYPVSDEVLLAWASGISRSLLPASLLVPAQVVLLGTSAWVGLRALRLPRAAAALGAAAVCSLPAVIAWQSNGAMPDPAALAWLVTCAALCAASLERPSLLAPAIVAGGLAIGTKTTAAPLTVAVLAIGLWLHRARLRPLARPLALATVLAAGAGLVWYARNLLDHGSPLWPFVAAPWGTPLPPSISTIDTTFASAPRHTWDVLHASYTSRFLGGILLLAFGVCAPLLRPRREVVLASLATVVSFLIWASAPLTGASAAAFPEATFSTTRYLLPALAAGALALALAARGRGIGSRLALVALAAVALVNLRQAFHLGFPVMPAATTPLAGALAGAIVAAAATFALRRSPRRLGLAPGVMPASAIALCALLAVPASGYLRRHAPLDSFAGGVEGWFAHRPNASTDATPILSTPVVIGTLAGDRLSHKLVPVAKGQTCADVLARSRTAYVLVFTGATAAGRNSSVVRCLAGRRPDYSDPTFEVWAPAGAGSASASRAIASRGDATSRLSDSAGRSTR